MRGAGRALLCVCVFSAAMATGTPEVEPEILNPHKVCSTCFFDELLEYYNEPSTHGCEWYKQYPFEVDTTEPLSLCLTTSQCANQHNPSNPFTGTIKPCRRDANSKNYITIARLTLPVHLTVKLWGESEPTRAWDGDWDGKNGLNFVSQWQNGVQKNVPPTNIGASTVDEDDFDRFYTRYGSNPWQSREQWPDAFDEQNNVCQGYQQTVQEITTAGAGASTTQRFNEVTTWWTSCLTSLDYGKLIADEDSATCQTCNTMDADCMGQNFIVDNSGKKCTHDAAVGYDATGITSACLRNRYSYSFSTCNHIDVCINFNFLKDSGVLEDRMKEAVGSSHVLVFKPNNLDVKLVYYANTMCAGDEEDFTGTVLDTRSHSVKLRVNSEDLVCKCDENKYSWYIERESGLRKCMQCDADVSPALYVGDEPAILSCFDKTMCKQCPQDQFYQNSQCVPCPAKTPQRDNWKANPYDNEDWKQCRECPDFYWYVPVDRCQKVEEMQLLSQADGQLFVDKYDFYQKYTNDDTQSGFEQVPMNYYRVTTDRIYGKKECFDTACSPSATFSFRQWCGAHAISGSGGDASVPSRDVYVKRTVDGVQQVRLWSAVLQTDDKKGWQIERKGNCTLCQECPRQQEVWEWGRYNNGCGIDLVNIGKCQPCMNPKRTTCDSSTCKFCGSNQAVVHNRTEGCNDGKAVSDYECMDCKFADVNHEQQSVHLLIGCGLQDTVNVWDLASQTTNEIECKFGDDGESRCHPDYTFKQPRKHDDFKNNFWLHPYGTRLPYCPPYYHFDTETCNLDQIVDVAWKSQCCKICAPLLDGYRKTAQYQTCPGWTIVDTQADQMTADCGAQSYTVENDDGSSTCEPCTTCNGESL